MNRQPSTAVLDVRLVALTDAATYPNYLEHAADLCRSAHAGSIAIVLRDRDRSARVRYEEGKELRRLTREFGQELWVSDRVDLARALDADGVHLPADGLRPSDCRRIWAGRVTRAGHELESLRPEDWAELDAVLISPVFAERKGRAPLGLEGLSARCRWAHQKASQVRVFALGGTSADNAPSAFTCGAAGIAAIGAVWDASRRTELLSALGIRP